MKKIIWLDPNIDSDENQKNFEKLNKINNVQVSRIKNINETIKKLITILFEETYIIVNGKLYEDFIMEFEDNKNNICFIPKIIIFTENNNEFLNSIKNKNFINDPFYNSGGVETDFDKIIQYIEINKKKSKIFLNREDEGHLSFDYIDNKEKLALPLLYKYLIEFNEKDNESFIKYLYTNYYIKSREIRNFIDSIISIKNIPIELLSKFYARIYTDSESKFFSDLNKNLRNSRRDEYLAFIKVLYEGVKLKSFPLASNIPLFRGTVLMQKEIQIINSYFNKGKKDGLPGAIIFSKAFLSFTKDQSTAIAFLNNIRTNINSSRNSLNSLVKVLFILEIDDKNIDYDLSTHADIEKISIFPEEREVLFFPFSSFEIKNIRNINGNFEINLLYLGKYLREVQNDYKLTNQEILLPETDFKNQIIESHLIENINRTNNTKGLIKKLQDNDNLIRNIRNPIYHLNPIYPVFDKTTEDYCIKGIINITKDDINKKIRVINSFEQAKKRYNYTIIDNESRYKNEEDIKNCEIRLNGQKYKFTYYFTFKEPSTYTIEYHFKNNLTKTNYMFSECFNLISLDLENFNCKNIINMAGMFFECKSLKELNLANLETKNVFDMNSMFFGCQSLKNLDLSFFNTQKVVNMSRLFFGCKSLSRLNLKNFNTQNVMNMYGMFDGCRSLPYLDILHFNTQNVINMSRMFNGCSSLLKLNLSNFNTNKVAYTSYMFCGCSSLTELNIANFNLVNAVKREAMLKGCCSLKYEKIIIKNRELIFE